MKSPLDEAILAAHPFDMAGWKKIDEVPFDFERRRVSVLVEHGAERRLIVKGAPEDLLRLSGRYEDADGKVLPLDPETRRCFEATLDELGAQGFRALGIASRVVDAKPPDRRGRATRATLFFPASPFSLILRKQAPGPPSRPWPPRAFP